MLTVMNSTDIMVETCQLADMIVASEPVMEYKRCKDKLQSDSKAQLMVQEFIKLKDLYEEVQRFGKYHPDYDRVSTQIREVKRELDLMETVAAYKKAEKEVETLLNEVSGIIAHAVSESIKVPTGNPFFDNLSCSGGCGSGGGCSC